ncbi:MAG TPA: hypothetical protein VFW29_01280 [Solirubrobacteraceae bacterium]|nr:hypothetical protein [Solirubrobacteraceae bacterium]
MNELVKGIKADLTDRRMLPLVGLVVAALIAALAYAALGGSSSSTTSPLPSPSPAGSALTHGIAVTEDQQASTEAVAETTDGVKVQRHGASHDPFRLLPSSITGNRPASTSSTSVSTATSSSASSTGSSPGALSPGGSPTSSGPTTPGAAKPHRQAKPRTVYHVALEFGALPADPTTEPTALTPYSALSKATPLPSPKERLIEFVGVTVTHSGKSASFAIDGELILSGSGTCLPSAAQCQVVDLPQGASEQMEYFSPSTGTVVKYELRVVSIASSRATAAAVRGVRHAQGLIEHGLLSKGGALRLAGLRFSSLAGVLVFAPRHHASSARASRTRGR